MKTQANIERDFLIIFICHFFLLFSRLNSLLRWQAPLSRQFHIICVALAQTACWSLFKIKQINLENFTVSFLGFFVILERVFHQIKFCLFRYFVDWIVSRCVPPSSHVIATSVAYNRNMWVYASARCSNRSAELWETSAITSNLGPTTCGYLYLKSCWHYQSQTRNPIKKPISMWKSNIDRIRQGRASHQHPWLLILRPIEINRSLNTTWIERHIFKWFY